MNDFSNPFEEIGERLSDLESMLRSLLHEKKKGRDDDYWMPVEEASQFTGMPIATLRTKVCRKEVPFVKKGKRVFFSYRELSDFMESGRKVRLEDLEKGNL